MDKASDYFQSLFSELMPILFIIVGILEPGVLSIFIFKPNLFNEYDVIKLLVLATCISIPSFTLFEIGSITWLALFNNSPNLLLGNRDRRGLIVLGASFNAILFNGLLIYKIYNASFSVHSFVKSILFFTFLFLVFTYFITYVVFQIRKKKRING